MLEFENVSLRFDSENEKGSFKVISDLSYKFEDGKITAIMGASGIGKTTLLNLGAGLISANGGRVLNTYKKTACVFQEPRLLPWKTALENVTCVCESIDIAKRCLAALLLEEADYNKYPEELSGGMRQRVSIARAMAYDADLVLLDEPFSGLDEQTKERVIAVLREHLAGRTAIIITHDKSELYFCDTLLLANDSPISTLLPTAL